MVKLFYSIDAVNFVNTFTVIATIITIYTFVVLIIRAKRAIDIATKEILISAVFPTLIITFVLFVGIILTSVYFQPHASGGDEGAKKEEMKTEGTKTEVTKTEGTKTEVVKTKKVEGIQESTKSSDEVSQDTDDSLEDCYIKLIIIIDNFSNETLIYCGKTKIEIDKPLSTKKYRIKVPCECKYHQNLIVYKVVNGERKLQDYRISKD